jgi:hypothetical protein
MQNFVTFAIFFLYAKSMRFARYLWGLEIGACVGSYEDLTQLYIIEAWILVY